MKKKRISHPFPPLKKHQQFLLLILSWAIVAFGQPAWVSWLGIAASAFGYALFWRVMLSSPNRRFRFCLSTGWFLAVYAVHISWLTADDYQGPYIFLVYALVLCVFSLQFGILALFFPIKPPLLTIHFLTIAAFWVILEWSRLFYLTGFSWSPTGLAMTGNLYSMQLVSIAGIYGLSFWIIVVNLQALRIIISPANRHSWIIWGAMALFPYILGFSLITFHDKQESKNPPQDISVVIVQTALSPGQRSTFDYDQAEFIPLLQQWTRVISFLKPHYGKEIDLIALPENVVKFGATTPLYAYEDVKEVCIRLFGDQVLDLMPALENPLAVEYPVGEGKIWAVGNGYWGQVIANLFQADVVVGLEHSEVSENKRPLHYGAAFYFSPKTKEINRYDKRILVPFAEYIPFDWASSIAAYYGISGSLSPGKEAKVYQGKATSFGISICLEEIYGNWIRESRLNGAQLLVNLSNDVWFPNSRLPKQHFYHGRLRAVENGVPVIRSCNLGVTGAIDSSGRTLAVFGSGVLHPEWVEGALHVQVPAYTYATLYTHTGDGLIIGFCLVITLLFMRFKFAENQIGD